MEINLSSIYRLNVRLLLLFARVGKKYGELEETTGGQGVRKK